MRTQLNTTTVVTYCLLAATAGVSFLLPDHLGVRQASAAGSGNTIRLPGIVRDFHKTNAEFAIAPSGGNGHYAGNISPAVGSDGRPVFVGGGYKVATEWKDKDVHPIPPNLYMWKWGAKGTIPVAVVSPSPSHGTIDTYNSSAGAYGGANIGPAPAYVVGAPMPTVVVPWSLSSLPNQGNLSYAGPKTISSDIHCNNLNATGALTISGSINIYCEGVMALATNASIVLSAGARLSVYVGGGGSDWNHVVIGDPLNPSRVTMYNLGTTKFIIHNHADVYAVFVSPNASVEISNHGSLYGYFVGKTVEYDNHGDFHVDGATPKDMCGVVYNDTAGVKGAASSGGIASATGFATWFKDTMGSNVSMVYSIDLTKNSSGVYEYLNDTFHPVDGELFGNEGQSHNNYFTYTITVPFKHKACSGTFFEFQGSDDAWMFVDGQLAMDLGGVIPGTSQYVSMDRLNLVDGKTYTMHFFYAQRQGTVASFRMRTNLDLIVPTVYNTVSAPAD